MLRLIKYSHEIHSRDTLESMQKCPCARLSRKRAGPNLALRCGSASLTMRARWAQFCPASEGHSCCNVIEGLRPIKI